MLPTLVQTQEQNGLALQSRARCKPFEAPVALRLWHLASLDAPTVAVVWVLGFSWAAGVHVPLWVPVLLALVAWTVYVGDRLLDARAGLRSGQTGRLRERHYFHWRHRQVLIPLAVGSGCAAAAIVLLLMPVELRIRNSVLCAVALAYFSGVHADSRLANRAPGFLALLFSKESLVGVLFTAACCLPTLSRTANLSAAGSRPIWALAAFFATLAWLNCHAIERWESGEASHIRTIAAGLCLAGLLLAVIFGATQLRPAALFAAGAASALLLALLDRFKDSMASLALRAAADLALLTPLALILR
jgi:hypothetical protein